MAHSENSMTSLAVAAGDTATATHYNNLRTDALRAKRAQAKGVIDAFFGADDDVPGGALLCSGKTIGDGSSSATARANADMADLFAHLWNCTTNSELVIQDSSGSNTTRGANAAADFAAHKRLPLPDLRGRFPLGMDNMGGSSANRVTATEADTIGKSSGSETTDIDHTHEVPLDSAAQQTGSIFGHGDDSPTTSGMNGSTTRNVMNPYLAVKYIVWSGVYW